MTASPTAADPPRSAARALTLAALALIALGVAAVPSPADVALAGEATPTDRARQFERNRRVISALVRGGIRLAGEGDPLKRAEHCTEAAVELAREVRLAAERREPARVAELGDHLGSLLERGVAANLSAASDDTPSGSSRERDLWTVRDDARHVLAPLDDAFGRTGSGREPSALRRGRLAVEDTLRTRPYPGGR